MITKIFKPTAMKVKREHVTLSQIIQKRRDYFEARSINSPSAAGVAENWFDEQSRHPVYVDHPPSTAVATPVSLLDPILAQFLDDCKNYVRKEEDSELVLDLSAAKSDQRSVLRRNMAFR